VELGQRFCDAHSDPQEHAEPGLLSVATREPLTGRQAGAQSGRRADT
jgi:hypothetical protein